MDSSHEDTIVRRGGGDANDDDDDSDELYIHACEREHCYSFRGGFIRLFISRNIVLMQVSTIGICPCRLDF